MENIDKAIATFIDITHIEYQTYDLLQRKIICSSGFAQKMLGYMEEEFVRLCDNFYEALIHPDDLIQSKRTTDKIINSSPGEIVESTFRFRTAGGSYIWVYCRKKIIEWDSNGNPTVVCTVAEDVTDFILLENRLREKIKRLNDIAWKNAHLLRGPVVRIIGLVDLIKEDEILSQHNLQIFQYVKQTIEQLDLVVHDINQDANE